MEESTTMDLGFWVWEKDIMTTLTVPRCIWERDKKYMCTSWEGRWKCWRGLAWEIRCLKWTKRDSPGVFYVRMHFECYKSPQYFTVTSAMGFFLSPSRQERIQWTHTLWLPNAWSCNPLLTWVVPLIAVGLLMYVGLLVDGLVWPRVYGFELGVGFAKDNNLPLW